MKEARSHIAVMSFVACALFCVLFVASPDIVAADTVVARTTSVVQAPQSACVPLVPTDLKPYIHNGELHSLEFTISDSSYVAVVGAVGNTGIPFQYMTRWHNVANGVRIHIDVQSTPIHGTLPIRVTLLSAGGQGTPACVSVVSASITSPIGPAPNVTLTQAPTMTQGAAQGRSRTYVAPEATRGNSGRNISDATEMGVGGSRTNIVRHRFSDTLCGDAAAAYRLWFGLLILYAALVGIALWAEMPDNIPWMRTPESVAVAILIALLLVLGFWYLNAACRSEFWMPLVAVLIAILGILAAFRNHPRVTKILLLQEKAQ